MKSKLIKNIFTIVLSSLLLIFGLIKYISSYYSENDGWGIDISFNSDYIVVILIGLIALVYGIYQLKQNQKNENNPLVSIYTGISICALVSFYPLGIFFKNLFKAISKNKAFAFNDYVGYLIIGIAGLIALGLFVGFLIYYFNKKKVKAN